MSSYLIKNAKSKLSIELIFMKKILKICTILLMILHTSCAIRKPEPMTSVDALDRAKNDLTKIEKIKKQNKEYSEGLEIDLYTAIALAINNNKDLKVRILEASLSNKKIEDVEFEMLPSMAANAGYTSSEKYKASTSASVDSNDKAGALGTSYSTSRNRDQIEQDIGFTWNALDFGISYIRAGQSSDRYLIAKENERKVANNIARDVIRAYWRTLSAQKLIEKYDPLLVKVYNALNDSQKIEELLLQKPMDALLYQKELLDIQRALQNQRQSFVNAEIELKSLLGLMPYDKIKLVETDQPLNELDMSLDEMEMYAMVNRPELIEADYEERISVNETKAGLRNLLPGLDFNAQWTSSNNDYLMNKGNFEYGSSIGANLLNVFRAPKIKKINEMNTEIIREQRLALSMAVLSQVHLSNIDYQLSLDGYDTADRYYLVAKKITEQVRNAQKIARFGELELIREEASLLVAELRKDLSYSDLQYAIAQVYTSVGIDVISEDVQKNTKKLASRVKNNFKKTGKNYVSIVRKPILEQKPIVKKEDEAYSKFSFSKNTFKMQGNGRTQLSAYLKDNAPLPSWITFLPSQRTFIINNNEKENVDEIQLIVKAKNINTKVEDKFTLFLDPENGEKKLAQLLNKKKRIFDEEKTKKAIIIAKKDDNFKLIQKIEEKNFFDNDKKKLDKKVKLYIRKQKKLEKEKNDVKYEININKGLRAFFEKFKEDLRKAKEIHKQRFKKEV